MRIVPIHFDKIESTQTYAKNFINENHIDQNNIYIITAEQQTAGYGSRGSNWQSIAGNLHVTYIIPDDLCQFNPLRITQCVALSVCHELENHNMTPKIKWRNDILLENKKVAGILSERINKDLKTYWVVGIGMNLYYSPDIKHGVSILHIYPKHTLHNRDIAASILQRILYNARNDSVVINSGYADRLAYLGTVVNFYNQSKIISGYFIGIDNTGHPILEIENSRQVINSEYRMEYSTASRL